MEEALFYEKISPDKVKCGLCNHRCLILKGRVGLCNVRQNNNGVLYSLNYGKVIAAHVDPIEKKPLFHFLPGSRCYSIAAMGCNFSCQHCQNADISQVNEQLISGENVTPEQVVKDALQSNCPSIAYTYTEPTIFYEFAIDCMKLAHKRDLKNIWVSNGYTTQEALKDAKPYLDAANIDLKFFKNESYLKVCGAKLQPVLDNLIWYQKNKIWLEITSLIIPDLNDSDAELKNIAVFIKNELGTDVPWHVSAFFPSHRMIDKEPTSRETIKRAYEIGKAAGLRNIYGGNILGSELENTYCPKCNTLLIARAGYNVERFDKKGRCPKCKEKITIIN